MPQQQKTDGFEGLGDLPDLTDQQHAFVQALSKGISASDAYRTAYNTQNMQPNTIWARASELKCDSKVTVWLNAYRLAGLSRGKRSLGQHLDRLTELSVKAELTGNYGAAVNAEVNAGKASGLYEQTVNIKDERPRDVEAELKALLGLQTSQEDGEEETAGHA